MKKTQISVHEVLIKLSKLLNKLYKHNHPIHISFTNKGYVIYNFAICTETFSTLTEAIYIFINTVCSSDIDRKIRRSLKLLQKSLEQE